MSSYFFQPTLILTRTAIKCFFHGYLIYSYSTQIICLLIIDIIFFFFCLGLYRKFINKVIAFLVCLYFLGFAVFDFYFVLEAHTNVTKLWDRQLIGFIICCSITGISLFLSFLFLIYSLRDLGKSLKKICLSSNSGLKTSTEGNKPQTGKWKFFKSNRIEDHELALKNKNTIVV